MLLKVENSILNVYKIIKLATYVRFLPEPFEELLRITRDGGRFGSSAVSDGRTSTRST